MRHTKRIFIDLDGPLLDGKEKHYYCYRSIIEKFGFQPIDLEAYWKEKKSKLNRIELLKLSGAESIYSEFITSWIVLIESPEALSLDKVQKGAISCLKKWKRLGIELHLVTMRKNIRALEEQLNITGINKFINAIFVSDHEDGGVGKADVVRNNLHGKQFKHQTWWIGDTEADWEAARSLGCKIFLVSNGLRNEKYLGTLKNGIVIPSINAITFSHE
jgi:phosphoglycolate phosphatase-like HAD superfamily hydrolase